MVVLSAQSLRKSFGLRPILSDASLTIHNGEHIGLVGINGSGKSTLGRLLAGVDQPDDGLITTRRDATVGYLEQMPRLPAEQSARAVVLSGLGRWLTAKQEYDRVSEALGHDGADIEPLLEQQARAAEALEQAGGWDMEHQADAVLSHVGIQDLDMPVGKMSGGEKRRVALAQLLISAPSLAILDEPTNHLDIDTIEWLERYLSETFRGAMLLITHDRYLLDRVVTRTLELSEGTIHSYEGGYGSYLEAKAERLAMAERTEANRQNFLRRELEWLRRQPKARTTKSKTRVAKVQAALAATPTKRAAKLNLESDTARTGHMIVDLNDVNINIGTRTLVRQLQLALRKGERIGIVGPNGAGKTTLLRTIIGECEPTEGTVKLGKNTAIAYLDQARSGLDESKSIVENVANGRTRIDVGEQSLDVRSYLERFLFFGPAQRQRVESLSGGERARVALAKMLSGASNLLVLDEPTNDLDTETLGALESLVVDFGGTALIVTHDRYFLDRVATAILAFEGNGKVTKYEGNFSDYAQKRARSENDDSSETASPKPPKPSPASKPPATGLTKAERRELEQIDQRIEAAETSVRELESILADPQTYADGGSRVQELNAQLQAAKLEVEAATERWEELELKAGES